MAFLLLPFFCRHEDRSPAPGAGRRTSLSPTNHPYMTGPAWTPLHEDLALAVSGAWTPLHEEVDLEVLEGAIPADLDGVYLRNTENPVHQPVWAATTRSTATAWSTRSNSRAGQASYRNRFIRTRVLRGRAGSRRKPVGRPDGRPSTSPSAPASAPTAA
jgi:hypothetical protein